MNEYAFEYEGADGVRREYVTKGRNLTYDDARAQAEEMIPEGGSIIKLLRGDPEFQSSDVDGDEDDEEADVEEPEEAAEEEADEDEDEGDEEDEE